MLRFRVLGASFSNLGASFSSFGCFVFEFWVLRFRVLGASFSNFGCFVFELWVLRASVFVFECFVFETTLATGRIPQGDIYSYWVSGMMFQERKSGENCDLYLT